MAKKQRFIVQIALLVLFANTSAIAQNPDEPGFSPTVYGLDMQPLVNEMLGLSMYYPDSAIVTPVQAGGGITINISDPSDNKSWRIQIWQLVMRSLANTTPAGVAEELIRNFQQSKNQVNVIANNPMTIGPHSAHFLVVEGDGVKPIEQDVGGFLIFATGKGRYIVFRLDTNAEEYRQRRELFLASFKTIRLTTTEKIQQERQKEFAKAKQTIELMSEDRLRSMIGTEQWYRIYQPDISGDWMQDKEIGYFKLTVTESTLGEVSPGRSAVQKDLGLLVTVEARYLINVERNNLADVRAKFWVKFDRSQERWEIIVTQKQGTSKKDEMSQTETQSGIRIPDLGFDKLTVIKNALQGSGGGNIMEFNILPDQPYLSQAEVYLLGSMLPRDGSISGRMAFHSYDTNLNKGNNLPVRLDDWNSAPDGSGNWILKSKPVPDLPEVVSTFNREGELLRREKGDGSITEPIELKRLIDIWKRKNLPTGG